MSHHLGCEKDKGKREDYDKALKFLKESDLYQKRFMNMLAGLRRTTCKKKTFACVTQAKSIKDQWVGPLSNHLSVPKAVMNNIMLQIFTKIASEKEAKKYEATEDLVLFKDGVCDASGQLGLEC